MQGAEEKIERLGGWFESERPMEYHGVLGNESAFVVGVPDAAIGGRAADAGARSARPSE